MVHLFSSTPPPPFFYQQVHETNEDDDDEEEEENEFSLRLSSHHDNDSTGIPTTLTPPLDIQGSTSSDSSSSYTTSKSNSSSSIRSRSSSFWRALTLPHSSSNRSSIINYGTTIAPPQTKFSRAPSKSMTATASSSSSMSGNHHSKNRLLMMRRISLFSYRNKNKDRKTNKDTTKDRPLRANSTFRVKYYAMQSRLPTKRAFVYAPMDEEEEENNNNNINNNNINNNNNNNIKMSNDAPVEIMTDASI
jgi:hypothetical protein